MFNIFNETQGKSGGVALPRAAFGPNTVLH